jgi:hypothetical protein
VNPVEQESEDKEGPIEVDDISADFEVANEDTEKLMVKESPAKNIMQTPKPVQKMEEVTDFDELD